MKIFQWFKRGDTRRDWHEYQHRLWAEFVEWSYQEHYGPLAERDWEIWKAAYAVSVRICPSEAS